MIGWPRCSQPRRRYKSYRRDPWPRPREVSRARRPPPTAPCARPSLPSIIGWPRCSQPRQTIKHIAGTLGHGPGSSAERAGRCGPVLRPPPAAVLVQKLRCAPVNDRQIISENLGVGPRPGRRTPLWPRQNMTALDVCAAILLNRMLSSPPRQTSGSDHRVSALAGESIGCAGRCCGGRAEATSLTSRKNKTMWCCAAPKTLYVQPLSLEPEKVLQRRHGSLLHCNALNRDTAL